MSNKRVSYYFDEEIGIYTFKKGHLMRPLRMKITDELIKTYKLDEHMNLFDSTFYQLEDESLYNFHSPEYIDLLKNINEENFINYQDHIMRFGFSGDCPFPSNSKFYDFCKLYTTGSMLGACNLNNQSSDIFINWSGGLHHAKRSEASGFCYVNDCVLAILELLKVYERVLYIDIDVHHGDGVEEAFFTTDRVMTCSFHKYGDFFPGTGNYNDIGYEKGKYHSVNFPLKDGIDDLAYEHIFKPVIDKILETFNPTAIVLQCGGDSLSGDKLGTFNLSVKGHGNCVKYIKNKGIPLMVLGGGGYTLRNVPRCWVYETGLCLDMEIDDKIPENDFIGYFNPTKNIHMEISNMDNLNSKDELEKITKIIDNNLSLLKRYSPELSNYNNNETKEGVSSYEMTHEIQKINKERLEEKSESNKINVN